MGGKTVAAVGMRIWLALKCDSRFCWVVVGTDYAGLHFVEGCRLGGGLWRILLDETGDHPYESGVIVCAEPPASNLFLRHLESHSFIGGNIVEGVIQSGVDVREIGA